LQRIKKSTINYHLSTMGLLNGKTALITGASRGIGKGIAQAYAREGAGVAFTYRSSTTEAEALVKELTDMGVKAKGYQSDASNFEQTEALVKNVLADFGQIDVLINNAGITRDTLMLRMKEEDWDVVMNTNLKSVFNLTKNLLRPMMKQRAGSIINISSVVGVIGQAGQANYAASKAGIIGFSKSIAKEMGSRNVRCNVIAPGFIATDMTGELDEKTQEKYLSGIPLKRFGTVEDVANVAVFLGSDMSAYVSGQTLSVCGAMI